MGFVSVDSDAEGELSTHQALGKLPDDGKPPQRHRP
jgi:hypothetical protein